MVHTKFSWVNDIADGTSDAVTEHHIFNFAQMMSSANRKHYKNVDRAGNAQLYTIAMRVTGNLQVLGLTAPNTYVTQRAVKDWHDARVLMYKRAGIKMKDLGYGRELRPYLSYDHSTGTLGEPSLAPAYSGDEWTYSRAAVTTPAEAGSGGVFGPSDLVDTYRFCLLGDSVLETDTSDTPDESNSSTDQDSYVSVGMLKEWLRSFPKKTSQVKDSNTQIVADNALLQLRSQQASDKEEVLELAAENQAEGRPWDLNGSSHYSHAYAGSVRAGPGDTQTIVMQVPCGLLQTMSYSKAAEQTVYTEFEVLGITDMNE